MKYKLIFILNEVYKSVVKSVGFYLISGGFFVIVFLKMCGVHDKKRLLVFSTVK